MSYTSHVEQADYPVCYDHDTRYGRVYFQYHNAGTIKINGHTTAEYVFFNYAYNKALHFSLCQ